MGTLGPKYILFGCMDPLGKHETISPLEEQRLRQLRKQAGFAGRGFGFRFRIQV